MKRHAVLIGYSGENSIDEYLPGVSKDLLNVEKFLLSDRGGAWNDEEIKVYQNKSKAEIMRYITTIKQHYDMLFIYYSGHGCYDTTEKCRVLGLPNNDFMYEKNLWSLASRQILICDSCSGIEESILVEHAMDRNSVITSSSQLRVRQYYDDMCMQCPEQQIKLYASSAGTVAEDLSRGGRYTSTLLDVLQDRNLRTTLNIRHAHNTASELVIQETQGQQRPDYSIPRYRDNQILPAAIVLPGI